MPVRPRHQLATRLFLLFLLAAALPLALSAWVSSGAITEVAERLSDNNRRATTRQTSRQVFDRLLAGKTLLMHAPLLERDTTAQTGGLILPGQGTVFLKATALSPEGDTVWESASSLGLFAAWTTASQAASEATRRQVPLAQLSSLMSEDAVAAGPRAFLTVQMRVVHQPGQTARVLLGGSQDGRLRWLAELNPHYLWGPLDDASEDSDWTITDVHGNVLAHHQGANAPAPQAPGLQTHRTGLFLGAEFGAEDWTFTQLAPPPDILWQGHRLHTWLALLGLGTLLGVTLLSRWQIRRTLVPLALLTDSAGRLAEGGRPQPVTVQRQDEIGTLAKAFNHMAGRIARREKELTHRAVHDSLTGLPNRDGLHQQLDALLHAPGAPAPLALLFIDLDHFKDVNDSRGHEAGDELLRLTAGRLREAAPDTALVSRLGGDEFVLLLPEADEARATALAQDVVARLARPFPLREGEHLLGASVGIALSPAHGRSREELLRCADIALYAAKAEGRGRHAVFAPDMDAAARDRVLLQAELRRALAQGEFVVHYQPRVACASGRITSAEALVRWQHPTRGLLYPGSFIEVAEGCGLIEGIGQWVLDATCAQIAAWRAQGLVLERVSVNVSPRQLATGELLGQVRAALDTHGIPASLLELEVTESLLVGDASQAREQLAELRRWGVSIALDDFGTGYSSMATLRQLPIDVMKVDRSFVVDLGADDGAMAVTCAIIAMARSLHLHLVAEGIETECQANVLRSMGVDELQGYLYSKPVPPAVMAALPGLQRAA
ncbi:EAL domain-containing protein [Aquabacterium sp.]|uniref:putative bifunctional diguanylate cyclase/phosphodiesterase n=1 Tax=Aquabacterium sp. TaxID=1872578 RepID=UPI0025C1F968|nr:EAL domain-containing protein [Aquabacterium sp.]